MASEESRFDMTDLKSNCPETPNLSSLGGAPEFLPSTQSDKGKEKIQADEEKSISSKHMSLNESYTLSEWFISTFSRLKQLWNSHIQYSNYYSMDWW